jgi:hypothetical protein
LLILGTLPIPHQKENITLHQPNLSLLPQLYKRYLKLLNCRKKLT